MSQITRTYTFTDGTTAYGSQVESEISNIVTTWDSHDLGTSTWGVVKATTMYMGAGSVSVPGLGVIGDTSSGISSPGVGTIAILSSSGGEVARFGNHVLEIRNSSLIQNLSGTAGAPTYTFTVGQNFGMYALANNSLGLSTNSTLRLNLDPNGNIILGSGAIATNATDGFLYIPTCAGAPTGVPTAQTGRVALVYNTTNHKFYIYDGSWLGGTNPGAFT